MTHDKHLMLVSESNLDQNCLTGASLYALTDPCSPTLQVRPKFRAFIREECGRLDILLARQTQLKKSGKRIGTWFVTLRCRLLTRSILKDIKKLHEIESKPLPDDVLRALGR